jgi:hypothetical protein
MTTVNATQFEPMLSTVVASQNAEVTLGKQPIMAEYGREVRNVISALPPELSRGMMAEYKEPAPQLLAQIEGSIMSRELAIENAAQEKTIDQEWLSGAGAGRKIDESNLGGKDAWNEPGA